MLQMNLRLGPEDLGYVVEHSKASFIAVDESLLLVAEAIAPQLTSVKGWIVLTDKPLGEIKTTLAPLCHYEDLVAAAQPAIAWPVVDERAAYSACYTTGTTGRPKGVYYSHRAIYLHSMTMAAALGMTLDDCTMLIPLPCILFAIAAIAFPAGLHALWAGWREERRALARLER